MREMKVRVWDDVLKEMLYSRVEQFDDMLGFRFEKHLETENPIYMWSTGLTDKNGKEIFDGDVIKGEAIVWADSGHYSGTRETTGVVSFEHARFYLEDSETGARPDLAMGAHYHEIIGNIYEHPHLLKGDKNA